jgi:hypothetical protein
LNKIYCWKKKFLDKKLQFTYPEASIKDFQDTEEAFSPQKRTSTTSKHDFLFFSTFVGHFCPPGSGSGSTDLIESGSYLDPDPKQWY